MVLEALSDVTLIILIISGAISLVLGLTVEEGVSLCVRAHTCVHAGVCLCVCVCLRVRVWISCVPVLPRLPALLCLLPVHTAILKAQ